MAVDLTDLIPVLFRETSETGADIFGGEDNALGHLQDSFWEGRIFGFFGNYTEADGLVTPKTGTDDLPREQQQLIVIFAGIRAIRMKLVNTNTRFHAVAGPVQFESETSANTMTMVLKQLQEKLNVLVAQLGGIIGTQVFYIDSIVGRGDNLYYGDILWSGSRDNVPGNGWWW